MDEDKARQLSEEATELLRERIEQIQEHYPKVRDAYQSPYRWPNLDPIRHEVALCITLGLPQAAITLTNHLLECLLKETLIVHHSKDGIQAVGGDVVDAFINGSAEAREAYGDAPLGQTINAVRRAGFISKEQKKELDQLREEVRNAYSHADRTKIFRDATIPGQPVKLEDGQFVVGEQRVVKAADLPIGQGLVQAHIAQSDAIEYFGYVDQLARELWTKLFPNASPPTAV